MVSFPGRSLQPQICKVGRSGTVLTSPMSPTGPRDCTAMWVSSLEPMPLIQFLTDGVTHAVYAPACLFNHSVLRRDGHCFNWKYLTRIVRLDRNNVWGELGSLGRERCCPASDLLEASVAGCVSGRLRKYSRNRRL